MNDTGRERQLDEILAAYLEAAGAGWAPDRGHLLRCYPHLADDLTRFFAGQDAVESVTSALRAEAPPPEPAAAAGVTQAASLAPPPAGDGAPQVSGYDVQGELGRGGWGVVYRARHRTLNRTVALKMLIAGAHASESERARFRAEATAIARLNHPNIVQIHEVGEYGGIPYLALEFCGGGSLEQQLGGTPLPPEQAAQLVAMLARGVSAAHEKGVVHRDLKPGNVLLTADGTPKITDFGLARKLDETGQTATGAVVGTPSYIAPEQASAQREKVGPACDVYALGAILYECLTGRPPFRAATLMETLRQVVTDEPVPPGQLNAQVPRDLETLCLKCLQKEPHKRYASAKELEDDLSRFLRGEPVRARPLKAVGRAIRWARRRPKDAALVTLAGLAVLGLAGGAVELEANRRNAALLDYNIISKEERHQDDLLNLRVGQTLASVRQCAALLQARQPVRARTFVAAGQAVMFPSPVSTHGGTLPIREVQWLPGVDGRERGSFEEATRAEGPAGFEIRELTSTGQPIRAAQREKYFPVQYASALKLEWRGSSRSYSYETPVLGIDQSADPIARAAMEQATRRGDMAATAWTTFRNNEALFRVFCPIYRDERQVEDKRQVELAGFLVGVIDLGGIIDIDDPTPDVPSGYYRNNLTHDLKVRVTDLGPSAGPALDFVLRAAPGQSRLSTRYLRQMTVGSHFPVADRRWRLEFYPRPD